MLEFFVLLLVIGAVAIIVSKLKAPIWHSGPGAPAAYQGNVRDYYLQDSNGDVYQKTGTLAWTRQGHIQGGPWPSGASWHSGAGAPSAKLGKFGDWYLRTSNGRVYQKNGATTWTIRAAKRAAPGVKPWRDGGLVPPDLERDERRKP